MAIVILGKTLCPLCGEPILGSQEHVAFSPFIANKRDPLSRFSDAAFHRTCFDLDADSAKALARSRELRLRSGPGSRRCAACGAEVTEPDDCFGTGLLSGDPGNPVAKFNYIHLHRSHFAQWASAGEFRAALESFLASDEWEGPKIEFDPMPKWTRPRER